MLILFVWSTLRLIQIPNTKSKVVLINLKTKKHTYIKSHKTYSSTHFLSSDLTLNIKKYITKAKARDT